MEPFKLFWIVNLLLPVLTFVRVESTVYRAYELVPHIKLEGNGQMFIGEFASYSRLESTPESQSTYLPLVFVNTIRASKMLNLILSSLVNIFTSVTLMDKTVLYFSSLYIWDLNSYYITVSVNRKYSATLMDKSAQSQQKPPTKISTNNCTLLFLSICLGCWVAESLSMHTFETIYLSGVL